jgi:hypothetical protein
MKGLITVRWALVWAAMGLPLTSFAADHIDAPAAIAEPAADITDVYAWMTEDAEMLNLIMNVHHMAGSDAKFSDAVTYVLHVGSAPAYGDEQETMEIVCQFYDEWKLECWAGEEYVVGDASDPEGLVSDGESMRVFAGRRDDPFFFELVGFKETVEAVVAAAPDLTFADGCPQLDEETSATLVAQLQHGEDGEDASNTFAGSSVLSLVIQLDKALVTGGGPIVGVWGSTHAAE